MKTHVINPVFSGATNNHAEDQRAGHILQASSSCWCTNMSASPQTTHPLQCSYAACFPNLTFASIK